MVAVLSLGGGSTLFRSQYNLKLKLDSAEGLGPGSVVQLLGVPIGNVETVEIQPADGSLILIMKIDSKFQNLITEGSTAVSKTQGALGDKFIFIEPSDVNAAPLSDGGVLIAKQGSDLMSTISSGGEKFEKIFTVIEELEKFSKALNHDGRSDKIFHNLAESSHQLKNLLTSTNVLLGAIKDQKNAEKSLRHLANVLEKIDNGDGTLGALVNDPSVHDSLKNFMGGSKRNKFVKDLVRESIKTGKD